MCWAGELLNAVYVCVVCMYVLGRSNAKKHLEGVECCTLAALKGLKANDLKAMGFKP